jgi:hypothetical protein
MAQESLDNSAILSLLAGYAISRDNEYVSQIAEIQEEVKRIDEQLNALPPLLAGDTAIWTGFVTNVLGALPIISSGGAVPTISHDATDGYLHVPATGTTNKGNVLTAGATAGVFAWTAPTLRPTFLLMGA